MVADQVERKHELDQKWISRSEGLRSCCFVWLRISVHPRNPRLNCIEAGGSAANRRTWRAGAKDLLPLQNASIAFAPAFFAPLAW